MAEFVEIYQHTGKDFKVLVSFENWRVAILNYVEAVSFNGFHRMERHMETDEVFVLLSGSAILLVGGDAASVQTVRPIKLERNTVYNVRQHVWHQVVMNADSSLLIVENVDTATENSEYRELEQRQVEQVRNEIEL